jgi:hypothetical protein
MFAGNSGDAVTFDRDRGTVTKRAAPARAARLQASLDLQRAFIRERATSVYQAPHVLSAGTDPDGGAWFAMRYVPGCPPTSPAHVAALVDWTRANAEPGWVRLDPAVVQAKLARVVDMPQHRRAVALVEHQLLHSTPPLPAGYSHGDCTLCNVLVDGGAYYFIDFLEPLVHSPVMDLVKLRQDTAHGWIRMYCECDAAALAAADVLVRAELLRHVSARTAAALQALNLLRIVPYARDARVQEFLNREIERCATPYC